jgi:hypothetical protein
MANRINRDTARENPTRSQTETQIAGYMFGSTTTRKYTNNEHYALDEVIAHLANAHENRRARQVSEWERMRGHYVQ